MCCRRKGNNYGKSYNKKYGLWIDKPTEKLNKSEFAKIKLKLATLKGFYSTFKQGFIFSYDPTEALQTG